MKRRLLLVLFSCLVLSLLLLVRPPSGEGPASKQVAATSLAENAAPLPAPRGEVLPALRENGPLAGESPGASRPRSRSFPACRTDCSSATGGAARDEGPLGRSPPSSEHFEARVLELPAVELFAFHGRIVDEPSRSPIGNARLLELDALGRTEALAYEELSSAASRKAPGPPPGELPALGFVV